MQKYLPLHEKSHSYVQGSLKPQLGQKDCTARILHASDDFYMPCSRSLLAPSSRLSGSSC